MLWKLIFWLKKPYTQPFRMQCISSHQLWDWPSWSHSRKAHVIAPDIVQDHASWGCGKQLRSVILFLNLWLPDWNWTAHHLFSTTLVMSCAFLWLISIIIQTEHKHPLYVITQVFVSKKYIPLKSLDQRNAFQTSTNHFCKIRKFQLQTSQKVGWKW